MLNLLFIMIDALSLFLFSIIINFDLLCLYIVQKLRFFSIKFSLHHFCKIVYFLNIFLNIRYFLNKLTVFHINCFLQLSYPVQSVLTKFALIHQILNMNLRFSCLNNISFLIGLILSLLFII
jgi:hypothetical protein